MITINDDEPIDQRVALLMKESEIAAVDTFRRRFKIRARNKAIRILIERGLQAFAAETDAHTNVQSDEPK